ncbi:MAG: GntR family transcriptional regulator [Alphaproteobacteria bacterium]|nr:GntR family transcriptional regulator [Alphaproteobacteria bacterium]
MSFSIDHKSSLPLHAQVEQLLRELIASEEYRKGKFLPNEISLAKQLGISRNTVRQATNKLVYEGLLVRKKGVGTQAAGNSVDTRINNWLSFTQEMKSKGIQIRNFEISTEWIEAQDEIAQFFRIQPGKKILKMTRLRGRMEYPFVYFISYFHPMVGLTGDEDFTKPLYEILEKEHSVIAKLSKEEISARAADKFLAQKLKINTGDPILKRKRYVFDPGSRPIEYNIGYYRADSFIYTIESERDV